MEMTKHASVREQQRAVPRLVIDLLITFGAREYSDDGTQIVYFDKRARKRVTAHAGPIIERSSQYLDCYLVVAASGSSLSDTGANLFGNTTNGC